MKALSTHTDIERFVPTSPGWYVVEVSAGRAASPDALPLLGWMEYKFPVQGNPNAKHWNPCVWSTTDGYAKPVIASQGCRLDITPEKPKGK
jgi:hypothetical protein